MNTKRHLTEREECLHGGSILSRKRRIRESSPTSLAEVELVSSCNSDKISSVFRSFNSQKSDLLQSTGFRHLLELPFLGSLNLNLCLWLYHKLDTENNCLRLDERTLMHFRNHDVSLVFGIPSEGRPVDYSTNQSKDIVNALIDKFNRVTNPVSLSVSFLEHILTKEYQNPMTQDEADVFKMAAILYAATYLLAPEPDNHFPLELVKNFVLTVNPDHLNWADLVLRMLGRASRQAKLHLNIGSKKITLFGCCLFLQVFYLDNLNFGPLTPHHSILPRGNAYSAELLYQLIELDSTKMTGDGLLKFGKTEVRRASEVCYTRRGQHHQIVHETIKMLSWMPHQPDLMNVVTHYQNFHQKYTNGMAKLSRSAAEFLTCHNVTLYHHASTEDVSSSSSMPIVGEPCHGYFIRKAVSSHSNFPVSPFDVDISHPDVLSRDKYKCYKWMTNPSLCWEVLQRDWIFFNDPERLCIPGHVVQHCLKQNGSFTVSLVDAIMVLWDYLDRVAYKYYASQGNMYRRWRHFLPASFAEAVIDSYNTTPDHSEHYYLNSSIIKSSFIGSHITYAVENCQKVIAPVQTSDGSWSCYFWDFKWKTVSVLDPMYMNLGKGGAREKHLSTVSRLHKAMVDCIGHFFSGWNIPLEGWAYEYITDLGPRSKSYNSGLYAVHYARSFTGSEIAFKLREPSESSLAEARGEILYQMFACTDNIALRPQDLMEQITVIDW